MARPQPPFNFAPLTDRDGLLLAPGSFYGWEVGGAVLSGMASLTNPTYIQLPGNLVDVSGATYTTPTYTLLQANRLRFEENNESLSFWFVIYNSGGVVCNVSAGDGWTFTAFALGVASSVLVLVMDDGTGARAFLAGITSAGGGGITSIADGTPGAESGSSELTISPDPISTTGTLALAATAAGAGPWGSGTQVPQITLSAGGRVIGASNVAISNLTINTTTPILGGGAVAPGGSLSLTHANTAVTPGSYGNALSGIVPTVVVDAKGHLTGASQTSLPFQVVQGDGVSITGGGSVFGPNPAITLDLASTGVSSGSYGDSSHVGAFTVDAKGRLSAASSVAISGSALGSITVTGTSPVTVVGSPVSLGGTITLSLANSGVVANTYVAASITVDALGRVTNASSASLRSISAGTGMSVTGGTSSFYANSATACTVGIANTAVTAGSYGNSTNVGTFTVNAQGQLTAASNVAISGASLGSITVTPSGPLTVGGSPVSLGGTLTLTNTALDSVSTRSWKAGSSAAFTGTSSDIVVVGDSASGGDRCVCIGSKASPAGNDNVAIGYQAGQTSTLQTTVVVGEASCGAGGTITASVAVGYNCAPAWTTGATNNVTVGVSSSYYTTTGTGNTAIGAGAGPGATFGTVSDSCSIGKSANANATNAIALGANVVNTVANSCLVGDSNTYITKSAGYLSSVKVYSCNAGRTSGTQTATFPGPVTLTINNTAWDNIGSGVSGNTILLNQANTQFRVTAWAQTSSWTAPAIGSVILRIKYYDGSTTTTLASSCLTTSASTPGEQSWACAGEVITPNVTTSTVTCELERVAGTTTSCVVNGYALVVSRVA